MPLQQINMSVMRVVMRTKRGQWGICYAPKISNHPGALGDKKAVVHLQEEPTVNNPPSHENNNNNAREKHIHHLRRYCAEP